MDQVFLPIVWELVIGVGLMTAIICTVSFFLGRRFTLRSLKKKEKKP